MLDSIESEIIGLLINRDVNHRTKNLISTKTIVLQLIEATSLSGSRMETCLRSLVSLDLEKGAWREERGTHTNSFVLFVRSGETRRAGSVYPPGVLQTKRTKAQFWARLSARSSRAEPTACMRRKMMYTCMRRESACKYMGVCVYACMRTCLRPWNTFTGFTASRHVYTLLIIHFTVLRYHLLRCLAVVRIGQERCKEKERWEKEQELDSR